MLKHKYIVSITLLSLVLGILFHLNWWFFLLVIVLFIGLTTWGSFDIRLNYFLHSINFGNTSDKKIAITFDDGPSEFTVPILEILKKHNVKATFFCIGNQIEKHPYILQKIYTEGHIIGNHTYSHTSKMGFLSSTEINKEISTNTELITNSIGKKPKLYRPPFGVTNPNIAKAVKQKNVISIGWNIRSLDTIITDEEKLFQRVKNKIKPGGIILFHDTTQQTVVVLERLLLFLQSEKYQLETVDALLNINAYED